MAFIIEPIVEAGAALAEDVGLGSIDSAVASAFDTAASAFDSLPGISEINAELDRVAAEVEGKLGLGPAGPVTRLIEAVKIGVSEGDILPREISSAIRWMLGKGGVAALGISAAAATTLSHLIALWGTEHGHGKAPVTRTHPSPAGSAITVGAEGEGARTPGGRMVGAAERGVARATVKVPGLTPTEATGISLAIARSYDDVMHVLITVVNDLVGEIRAVGDLVGTVHATTHTTPPAPAAVPTSVTVALSGIEAELARLVHGQGVLDARIATVESGLSGARQQIATTTGQVQGIVHGLPGLVGGIVAGATGGLATSTELGRLQGELTAEKGAVAGLQSELQTAGVPNLPTEIAGLEDCCAENKAVTQPIKDGGATPSLLRRLGGLLTYGYALGLVAGFVGTFLTILDTPASILGTIRGAEWVMPIAERAALQALGDVTWSDTIATAS